MTDTDALAIEQNSDDVEPIRGSHPSVSVDPDPGGPREFPSLPPPHRFDRIAAPATLTRLHLDEGDDAFRLRSAGDEVDVTMAGAIAMGEDPPPPRREPSRRDSLAEYAELLPGR